MDEQKLQEIILDYFDRGDWNYNHTLAAVYWIKELIKKEGGNEKVLITTMHLHDIGYGFKGDLSLEERLKRKEGHMERGARLAEEILQDENYSEDEVKQIVHLIGVHDKIKELRTKDEFLIMEADSLSGINYKRSPPTMNKEEFDFYLEGFKKNRAPRFKTKTGKKFLKELLIKVDGKV